jgi:UPF0755 protein
VIKGIARVAAVTIAILIVALPLLAGAAFVRSRLAAAPAPDVPVAAGTQGGIQRQILGAYLGLRDNEIHKPAGNDSAPVTFIVRQGETPDLIGGKLQAAGLINDAGLFSQLVKYQGAGPNLQAGQYQLRQTMNLEEIIGALQRAQQNEIRVTIGEGWRLEQIAQYLSQNGLSTYEDLTKAMTGAYPYSILSEKPAGASLEGYLFPDTYRMDPRWSAEQIVDLLVKTMDQRFTPEMRQQAKSAGLSVHQVLTIASMIEREAVLDSERPTIASVILNRLAKNMPLQVDSTVQYALGYDKAQKRWWPNLKIEQLNKVDSPYSTYKNRGLPPGPIASPRLASIQAVVQPPQTPYLYWFAKGDNSHAFAATYEEHLENQKKYQK